jgi:predicted DNA-binding transcriptional regulator AlpA
MTLPYPPPFQDLASLAEHLCAGESTIERLVREGRFPQPKKMGGKNIWCWSEVVSFLEKDNGSALSQEEGIREATRRISQGG